MSLILSPFAHTSPCSCPNTKRKSRRKSINSIEWKSWDPTSNNFNTSSSTTTENDIYVWFYLPCGNGFTKSFVSLEEAYVSGERYVFERNTVTIDKCEEDDDCSLQWKDGGGNIFCSPNMRWCYSLCEIKRDIAQKSFPLNKQWVFLTTPNLQMILCLGKPVTD